MSHLVFVCYRYGFGIVSEHCLNCLAFGGFYRNQSSSPAAAAHRNANTEYLLLPLINTHINTHFSGRLHL